MNKFFLDDLTERFDTIVDGTRILTQKEMKTLLLDENQFPMICNEHTPDSNFEVTVDESKFLNDKSHNGTWILGGSEDSIDFILCLKTYEQILFIDVLEVNSEMRNQGIGGNVVSIIESVAEQYFSAIFVSPFDTDAINFWEHMEYCQEKNGNWIKLLN